MPERARRWWYKSLPLLLAIGIVWTVFFALLIYRTWVVASTDEKLCNVIRSLIVRGGEPGIPGSAGYAYYLGHPDELQVAKANYRRLVNTLSCHDLPTAPRGGRP